MENVNIIVLSQNIILDSLQDICKQVNNSLKTVFVSTHLLFRNEQEFIKKLVPNSEFLTFADFLTDKEMEECDLNSYIKEKKQLNKYYEEIKKEKNRIVIKNINLNYNVKNGYILSDDLGIYKPIWLEYGYIEKKVKYYYEKREQNGGKANKILNIIKRGRKFLEGEIYTFYYNGVKYIFYGKIHRIGYRINVECRRNKIENIRYFIELVCWRLFKRVRKHNGVIHLSTLHEMGNWEFPADEKYEVVLIQDGYLPSNYSSQYLKFNGSVKYYVWDVISKKLFINQKLDVEIMPFRKKIFLPNPQFSSEIKTVLIVASGAGDWTALKNRSDEDLMVRAIGNIAKEYKDIKFIYRCHPVWVHPEHQGVNSINRVKDFFEFLDVSNLKLSGNIPETNLEKFQLSFVRSSLEEDLKGADLVIGEHSISMIDAAMQGIPFVSVNLTKRRNFFCEISDLGFPHCENEEQLTKIFVEYNTEEFISNYVEAISKYNKMVDMNE